MTATSNITYGNSRRVRPTAALHIFTVGQAVRLRSNIGTPLDTADAYRITGTLPVRDNLPQYRIRGANESHERVVTEEAIEPVHRSQLTDDAALLERIFDHGQRTKA